MKGVYCLGICVSGFFLAGCQSIGPKAIQDVQPSYNETIARTDTDQLLLNMVRLRYRDNPCFIGVSNIVENRKFTTSFDPGIDIGFGNTKAKNKIGIGISGEIFQNPTITLTPLKGEAFTKSLAQPIPLPLVLGLMQIGWSPKRVFSLCVEQLNGLDNASTASGPTPKRPPYAKDFEEAVRLINKLHKEKQLIFGIDKDDHKSLVMKILADQSSSASTELKHLLDLDFNKSEFKFVSNFIDYDEGKNLSIRTRSLMEVLFYISHTVQVPEQDIENGLVTKTLDKEGNVFDWSTNLSGKWFQIQCSQETKKPTNTYACIHYRNKWFYVADNDLNSKTTLMLLKHLFDLLSGNPNTMVPNLVIGTN